MNAKAGLSRSSLPLVLFDCDGVLIDSEAIACRTELEILGEIGHPITLEAFQRRFVGTSRHFSLAALAEDWGRPMPADYVDRVRDRLDDVFRSELRAIAGMVDLVRHLEGRCAVASSSSLRRLGLTLGLTGYAPLLEGRIFSAEQVSRGKPAPDLFLFAADRLGVAPKDCLVVEDSPFGVEAARAAGMAVIGFTAGAHCGAGHATILRNAGAAQIAASARALADLVTAPG